MNEFNSSATSRWLSRFEFMDNRKEAELTTYLISVGVLVSVIPAMRGANFTVSLRTAKGENDYKFHIPILESDLYYATTKGMEVFKGFQHKYLEVKKPAREVVKKLLGVRYDDLYDIVAVALLPSKLAVIHHMFADPAHKEAFEALFTLEQRKKLDKILVIGV